MKYLCFLIMFLLIQEKKLIALSVSNVRVSVTADSSASAREQAIEKAHSLAFLSLLKENFPETPLSTPSQDKLVNMVTDFSIDMEKTTPQSYSASLTFQFDEASVKAWLQQNKTPRDEEENFFKKTQKEEKLLKIKTSYASLSQWQHLKKNLELLPELKKMTILSFSSKKAEIEIVYLGDIARLQHHAATRELVLTPHGGEWELSFSTASLPSKIAY